MVWAACDGANDDFSVMCELWFDLIKEVDGDNDGGGGRRWIDFGLVEY